MFELMPPGPGNNAPGGAWTETVLHTFTNQNGDGAYPFSSLAMGTGGSLYGTTSAGGAAGQGTLFEPKPPASGGGWSEVVLHSFQGIDGSDPQAGLVAGRNGFYGTTFSGGAWNNGAVFELAPPATSGGAWTETVVHSFHCCNDGSGPGAGLLVDKNGDLFGVTGTGGGSQICIATPEAYGCGVVFALQPPVVAGGAWTESILHRFTGTGSSGEFPATSLVFGANALYGTASQGGSVVFAWRHESFLGFREVLPDPEGFPHAGCFSVGRWNSSDVEQMVSQSRVPG